MSRLKRILAAIKKFFFAPPVNSGGGSSPPLGPENPVTPPSPPDAGAGDDLDLSTVSWLGTPVRGAKSEFIFSSASIKGDKIHTMYLPYFWPSNGKQPKPCDAVVHLFYEQDGKVVGGKFDWWSNGGQSTKGLENVRTGYHGHQMPANGTPTWTMISSLDGTRRSNTVKVMWR